MINSKTKNLACSYAYIDYLVSPKVERPDRRVVRRGAGQQQVVRPHRATRATATIFHADDDAFWKDVWYWQTPEAEVRRRPDGRPVQGLRRLDQGLDGDQGLIGRAAPTTAPVHRRRRRCRRRPAMTTAGATARPADVAPAARRLVHRRPRVRLGCPRACRSAWLVRRLSRLARRPVPQRVLDSGRVHDLVVREFTLNNFVELFATAVYRTVTLRTVGMAIARDRDLRRPRLSRSRTTWPGSPSPRTRASLAVAVLMPLWASYLVKAYSWRLILAEDGVLDWLLAAARPRARASATSRSG